MLKKGANEHAQSSLASAVVLVPKADGLLRFNVDCRKLNSISVRGTYLLPQMDECFDSLRDPTIPATLDAHSWYWQVPIVDNERDKMVFVCHAGLYRFQRMAIGLTNAPATLRRTLDIILFSFKWKTCSVNLDDIIIFSTNRKDHSNNEELILKNRQSSRNNFV